MPSQYDHGLQHLTSNPSFCDQGEWEGTHKHVLPLASPRQGKGIRHITLFIEMPTGAPSSHPIPPAQPTVMSACGIWVTEGRELEAMKGAGAAWPVSISLTPSIARKTLQGKLHCHLYLHCSLLSCWPGSSRKAAIHA